MSAKAGNPRLRTTLIQLAWLWLRNQPQSALALWFKDRVCRNGGLLKKTPIVALAMAAQSAAIGAGSVVQGQGLPQWRPSQEDDHRGAGAQAAGGAVEICDCRRRHRGRHCEECLKGDRKRLKQSTGLDQSRRIRDKIGSRQPQTLGFS